MNEGDDFMKYERNVYEEINGGIRALGMSDKFLEERIIFLDGSIGEGTGVEIAQQLMYLDSLNNEPIKLYINSPGGHITEGLTIIDTMELINSPVYTINMGSCCSMGFAILVRGDKRYALSSSEAMCHQASGWAVGNIQDVKVNYERLNYYNDIMADKICEAIEMSKEEYFILTQRDYYMDAKEMIEFNVVDKILLPEKNRKGKKNFKK